MVSNKAFSRAVVGLFVVMFVIMSLGLEGCASLRRKFTRKREKKTVVEEVPVLEPVEYVPKEQSPRAIYEKYYGLWRVWTDEIVYDIGRDINQKRMAYLLNKAVDALIELKAVLKPSYREKLDGYIKDFDEFKSVLADPARFQDFASLRIRLESTIRDFRREFRPSNFFNETE